MANQIKNAEEILKALKEQTRTSEDTYPLVFVYDDGEAVLGGQVDAEDLRWDEDAQK